jgi:hypothetical protein
LCLHIDSWCLGGYVHLASGFWLCDLCVVDLWCLHLVSWYPNLDLSSLGLCLDLWCLGMDGCDV